MDDPCPAERAVALSPDHATPYMTNWAQTIRQRVTVRLADGGEHQGFVHLHDSVPHRTGPETPLDLLNRTDAFFALSSDEGEVRFISKAQVAVVSADLEPYRAYLHLEGARESGLEVDLAGGGRCTGRVAIDFHPTRPRALDYLNAPAPFFLLLDEPTAHFLNRAHVTLVRPRD